MPPAQLTPEHAKLIGDLLKNTREQHGRNINDVAYQIALSPAQLRAIEAADLRPFYSHSFFYQAAERYAKFLNVALPSETALKKEAIFSRDTQSDGSQPNASNAADITAQTIQATPTISTSTTRSSEVHNDQHATAPASEYRPPFQTQQHSQQQQPLQPELPSANKSSASRKLPALALVVIVAVVAITLGIDRSPEPTAAPEVAESAPNSTTNSSAGASDSASATPASAAATVPSPVSPAASPVASSAAAQSQSETTDKPDSSLESSTTAWVQIVKKNGDKSNLKVEPGQKIEFASAQTAAIVFGQPDKAKLIVKGRAVDANRFVTPDNPGRALVILNQIP
jgi:hypothetical protein